MTTSGKNIQSGLEVTKREVKRLFSNKVYLFCMFVAPLFCLLFFLSLMHKGLPTDLPLALVDLDNSSSSGNLARQLDTFEGTQIIFQTSDFSEAREIMQKGEIYGILLIPGNFAKDAVSGKQPKLSFYTNNSYLIAGSLLFRDLKTISVLASASVGLQTGRAKGYTDDRIMTQLQPIVIDTHPIGNPWLNYSVYLNNIIIPGILQLMIFCVTVYSIGIEIKERTTRKWLRTGNNSLFISLIGKLIPQTILFLICGLIIYATLYGGMNFPFNGSIFSMLLLLFLFIIAGQAFGVFMIGVLPTLRLGLSFACIWGMISFSICGFSFPVTAMYPPVQALSNLFPLRHYFLIYVDQALNGREILFSWEHYIAMTAFLILPFLVFKPLTFAIRHAKHEL
ncbi:MAG: ABC transporter permease [Dysgonamonadaceae bacterium]|jgi:ABC-2 type transport system permease protein|nr:ABC transporter permease [Dysgonamonadaceae bacterium]